MYTFQRIKESESLKQPYNHQDYDHNIQNCFDLAIHGNVGVYKPEQYSYNNQDDDDGKDGHRGILDIKGNKLS